MKSITLSQAAKEIKIAEIRIHGLIRQKQLQLHTSNGVVVLDAVEWGKFKQNNADVISQWQESLEHTRTNLLK